MLRPSNAAELDALVESEYYPTSPAYEQWLTPDQLQPALRARRHRVEAARRGCAGGPLRHDRRRIHRARHLTVEHVADALGVSFSSYSLADGKTGYSLHWRRWSPPRGRSIEKVIGLSDTVRFEIGSSPLPTRRRAQRSAPPRATTNAVAAPRACPAARSDAGLRFWTPDELGSI